VRVVAAVYVIASSAVPYLMLLIIYFYSMVTAFEVVEFVTESYSSHQKFLFIFSYLMIALVNAHIAHVHFYHCFLFLLLTLSHSFCFDIKSVELHYCYFFFRLSLLLLYISLSSSVFRNSNPGLISYFKDTH
jgi:hypothetical protein